MDIVTLIVIVVGLIVFVAVGRKFLGMAKSDAKKMTKKDLIQSQINERARGTDKERWRNVGKSARKASKKGCLGKFIVFVIIVIVLLALFDALTGGGFLESLLGQ